MKEKGAAILPGVLNPEECDSMNLGMWEIVEHLTSGLEKPVKRDDPESYAGVFKLVPNHGGLIQHHKWGFAQYAMDVRQNPKVADVYRLLYGEDLLVSLDGVNCSLGAVIPGKKPRGAFQGRTWLHTDQSPLDNDFKCVQSFITANKIGVGDATFRFLSGSHNLHQAVAKQFNVKEKADWFKYEDSHLEWLKEQGCVDTCFTCGPGDQIFWDSRLAHSGMEYIVEADCPTRSDPRPYRNVVYVCFWGKPPNPHSFGFEGLGLGLGLGLGVRGFPPEVSPRRRGVGVWGFPPRGLGVSPRSLPQQTIFRPGIGPGAAAWKAAMLPLHHRNFQEKNLVLPAGLEPAASAYHRVLILLISTVL